MKFLLSAVVAILAGANLCSAQLINGSIIVSEINYHNDSTTSSGDWFELYNTSSSPVNIGSWTVRDNSSNSYTLPAGVSLGGNQYLVVVNDIASFTAHYPSVLNYIGQFGYNLGNHTDQVRLFNSDDVLQYSVTYYGDTLGWPKGSYGYGHTLELANTNADPNSVTSWFDGCMFGSPGVAYQPCNPPIVYSEINYHSDSTHDSGDWVELHNTTNASISLTGWRLRDSNDSTQFIFPTVTMPSNAYLVVYNDLTLFNSIHPNVNNKVGPTPFGFSKSGEVIRLYNAQNKLQYSVVYDDKEPWDTTADGDGYTLELLSESGHMDDGNNWFAGCLYGSPGAAYNPNCANSITTVNQLENVNVYPTLDYSAYNIQTATSNIQFLLFDIQAKQIANGMFSQGLNTLNMQALPAGIFILTLNDSKTFATYKLVHY